MLGEFIEVTTEMVGVGLDVLSSTTSDTEETSSDEPESDTEPTPEQE